MTKTSAFRDAALQYAKNGWKVFPLEESEKVPKIPVREGGKGVHDATTDKQQIENWFARWPNANIGVHCEDFFVLDCDPKNGGPASLQKLIDINGPLPTTLRQSTPSGGTHFIFKSPLGIYIKNRAGFVQGLDTRAYGGYICVEPSETDNGAYKWENPGTPIAEPPDWLIALVRDSREGFKQSERSDTGSRDIDDAALAGYLLNGGLTEDQIFNVINDRNNDPKFRDVPLPTNEIWKTVRSICKREIRTPSSLRQAIHDNIQRRKVEENKVVKANPLWEENLVRSATGIAKNCLSNAEACLTNSPLFADCLAFDELRAEARLTRNIVDPISQKTIGNLTAGALVDENIIREMTSVAQRLIREVTFTEDMIGAAVQLVARHNAYHPVQDYLNALVWDGVERIDRWLIDHIGVEDDSAGYVRGIGRRWLISAVSRAMKPGCKSDCMLILEGPQGIGKSPALAVLAGQEWFKDSAIDFRAKDKFSATKGVWLYELAEFDQYRNQDAATIKSFLSSQYDSYRPPYGRSDVQQPRGLIFAGTTNKEKYLVDETGNKRFWPVRSKLTRENPINLKRLAEDRDQLWSEAVRAYYNGEPGFIDMPELMKAHEAEAMKRHDTEDVWESRILDYCYKRDAITTSDILKEALDVPLRLQTQREQNRVRRIMELNHFELKSVRQNGKVYKAWRQFSILI